ncbi:hypothetical protein RRG08_023989 [Elysia crispata]|uniref:Uncharacterized protein n=1 Tax=Elysia crispata TaxID=231223 RepID=A0AAE1D171_9GAST|nr:hypothetical protein RRG08_023989 [Elysia crispata]
MIIDGATKQGQRFVSSRSNRLGPKILIRSRPCPKFTSITVRPILQPLALGCESCERHARCVQEYQDMIVNQQLLNLDLASYSDIFERNSRAVTAAVTTTVSCQGVFMVTKRCPSGRSL